MVKGSLHGREVNFILLHGREMFLHEAECISLHGFLYIIESNTIDLMPKLQYCIYVLLSLKDNKLYIGYSTDLKQRLTDHFHGQSKATNPRRPFKLIYCEYFLSKKDATRREKYLKTSTGKKMLKQMLRHSLSSPKS